MSRRSGFNKRQKDGDAGLAGGANNATRAFSSGEVYEGGGGGSYFADSVPVGYWTFEDGSGDTVADVSSAGNNLSGSRVSDQLNQPIWDTSTKVRGSYSLLFDHQDDDSVVVPDNDVLDFSTDDPFSISCWFKRGGSSPSQIGGLVVKSAQTSFGGVDSPFEGYSLYFNDTQQRRLAFYLYRNITGIEQLRIQADAYLALDDTDWHNVVVTYDGSSDFSGVNMYLDGSSYAISLEATDTLDPGDDITTSTALCFGGFINNTSNNSGIYNFKGNMDEVAMWGKELSSEEVSAIYNSGSAQDLADGIPSA